MEVNISSIDLKLWHEHLGHVGARALYDMLRGGLVEGVKLKNTDEFVCEPCQFGEPHVQTFRERPGKRSTEPSACIRMCANRYRLILWGGAKYYVTFIDDASGF